MDDHAKGEHFGAGPHVVVVGGGFGGVEAAIGLGRAGVAVTLIDRRNYHLFQPLLYQVATAALSPADIAEPTRKLLRHLPHAQMRMGDVTGIDHVGRRVLMAGQPSLAYDRLIIATGASHSYFGHDEWQAVAPGLKSIDDARAIRSRLLLNFERAELEPSPQEQKRLMTTAVIGGGPTGVELAGAAAELARYALARDFRRIRPQSATVLLIEAGPRLLATFPEQLSSYAHSALERLGVQILLQSPVEDITSTMVKVSGRDIPVGTTLWAAGVRASPVARWLGLEADRQGRVAVSAGCGVTERQGVYVIGDAARMIGANGEPLPGLAQVAQQQGRYLGRSLAAELKDGRPRPPFRYRNRGNAAIVGRNAAVFDFGSGWTLTGRTAWLLWAIVHVWLLVGFENRLLVTLKWVLRYLTYERGSRLITDSASATLSKQPEPAD